MSESHNFAFGECCGCVLIIEIVEVWSCVCVCVEKLISAVVVKDAAQGIVDEVVLSFRTTSTLE